MGGLAGLGRAVVGGVVLVLIKLTLYLAMTTRRGTGAAGIRKCTLTVSGTFCSFGRDAGTFASRGSQEKFSVRFFFARGTNCPVVKVTGVTKANVLFAIQGAGVTGRCSTGDAIMLRYVNLSGADPFGVVFSFKSDTRSFYCP